VNYDNSLVVTITVTCNLWVPSSRDHLFTCGAIYLPPQHVSREQVSLILVAVDVLSPVVSGELQLMTSKSYCALLFR